MLNPRPSSAMAPKRHMPRVSTMPQFPIIQDTHLDVDQTAEFAIVVSMYEVYNDRIFDLLAGSATSQSSKTTTAKRRHLLYKSTEHSPDRKTVAGLRKVVCETFDEALLVLETGLTERRVAGTGSNATSSRSHGFFCVEVKKRLAGTATSDWSSSALTIVDLAGEPLLLDFFIFITMLNNLTKAPNAREPQKQQALLWLKQARLMNPSCISVNACRCNPTTPTLPTAPKLFPSANAS
jgi:hypothetical protein